MRVDRSQVKRHGADLPPACKKIIENVIAADEAEFVNCISNTSSSVFVKSDLANWIELLDKFDEVFEKACSKRDENSWVMAIDRPENSQLRNGVMVALHFTASLFEHSFSRHIYASTDRLISLLDCNELAVIVAVLSLLYVISKRSNFLTRISNQQRQKLIERLHVLAESWGGKENGFSLDVCCRETSVLPSTASALHFEYYEDVESKNGDATPSTMSSMIRYIHIENVDKMGMSSGEIMDDILRAFKVPKEKQLALLGHIRLAQSLPVYQKRLLCVIARLQALSVLMYSGFLQEPTNNFLYNGFIEECSDVLHFTEDTDTIVAIKTEVVKTLTAVIYLDRHPKLTSIIEAMSANSYHGFLPTLVRNIVQALSESNAPPARPAFCTALFSLLYHMAGYDNGAEALVSSGLTETLLNVISWHSSPIEAITFVTRSVRVIDLITNVDVQSFQALGGMKIFINRLAHEVDLCRTEQPYEIPVIVKQAVSVEQVTEHMETDETLGSSAAKVQKLDQPSENSAATCESPATVSTARASRSDHQCHVQRSALIKSLLNFIKKAIQDPQFAECIRHLMDGALTSLLRHMISNPEYYGASLFLLAINVVTVFIFQEPSQMSSLQDKGLTDTIMQALLVKDVPATREVLASLPNTFSALCLNERGLNAFVQCRPFEKLFKVLLSTKYLNAMRRRRNTDPLGDTAISLGTAIDELMRHQPTLKQPAMQAVIELLQQLCVLGSDSRNVCVSKWNSVTENVPQIAVADGVAAGEGLQQNSSVTSDEEDDDEDSDSRQALDTNEMANTNDAIETILPVDNGKIVKTPVPLIDYVQNIMKFIEAILSNNATDDHARLFIQLNGLEPFMKLLLLPNLPSDFGTTNAAQSLAGVARYLMTLTRDGRVLDQVIKQLNERVMNRIDDLLNVPRQGHSVLIEDLLKTPVSDDKVAVPSEPSMVRILGELQSHLAVLSHLCRLSTNQGNELKVLVLVSWMERGGNALQRLHDVYRVLLWESTVLLTLCSGDSNAQNTFAKDEIKALIERGRSIGQEAQMEQTMEGETESSDVAGAATATATATATVDAPATEAKAPASSVVVKQLKPLIALTSRVARYLSDLFGSLLKMSVGSAGRPRRGQIPYQMPPVPQSVKLIELLMNNFRQAIEWRPSESVNYKLWLAYLVCCISYVSQLLFDDRKNAYHLVLLKFYSSGAQHAFFRLFDNVMTAMKADRTTNVGSQMPEGFNEFLEAWLTLVEKLLSPTSVLDSQYHLFEVSGPTGVSFNPTKYLGATQKMTFENVVVLWKHLVDVNARVSELVLNILCHVIRVQDTVNKEAKKAAKGATTEKREAEEERTEAEQQVNPQHLQQLIDIGFNRELAVEALLNSPNVDQAAEFCIIMPAIRGRALSSLMFEEDDQLQQAIAMLLDNPEENPSADGATTKEAAPSSNAAAAAAGSSALAKTEKLPVPLEQTVPLEPHIVSEFFEKETLICCLCLIERSPDLVYRVADLLSVVIKSSSASWTRDAITRLSSEIINSSESLLGEISREELSKSDITEMLCNSSYAKSLSVRLHLFCLLFEEFKSVIASVPALQKVPYALVQLLGKASSSMSTGSGETTTPKFISPLLLCLNLFESEIIAWKYREQLNELGEMMWKFWDNRIWTDFTPLVNKQLTEAYAAGQASLRFTVNRRRYMVDFRTMMQVNQDSGFQRPVLMFPTAKPEPPKKKSVDTESSEKTEPTEMSETASASSSLQSLSLKRLSPEEYFTIIRSCVDLIVVPVDADTLHAALRLCLRLTRNYALAVEFLHLDGLRKLLRLRQNQAFSSLPTIVSLLVRHVLEDQATLQHNMEKIVRAVVQGAVSTPDAVRGSQEYHYVMRLLGPLACRSPKIFSSVCERVLRIRVPPPRKSDDDEANLLAPNVPLELRVEGTMTGPPPPLTDAAKSVLTILLTYLVQKLPSSQRASSKVNEPGKTTDVTGSHAMDSNSSDDKKLLDSQKASQPLVLKSSVLKLLAELIRGYSGVAGFIAEFKYTANGDTLVEEECSSLAFMLDYLLADNAVNGDTECAAGVRAVVAVLAASNHCEAAQSGLITELKAALLRAANYPESLTKHQRLCALVNLVTLMKDACPSVHLPVQTSGKPATPLPLRTNNIIKWLTRKKVVLDLARLVLHLDLASPHTVNTVNAILKPLEDLSRIINMPTGAVPSSQKTRQRSEASEENSRSRPPGETESRLSAAGSNMPPAENSEIPSGDTVSLNEQSENPETVEDSTRTDRNDSLINADIIVETFNDSFDNHDDRAHGAAVTCEIASESSSSSSEHTAEDDDDDDDDDDGDLDEDEVPANQEDGNEAGSEHDEDPSEYEDVDEEVAENEENEHMEEDDMSDFGDFSALEQSLASQNIDPLDVLNDVLRHAITRRDNLPDLRSTIVVSNRDGSTMNMPDVEQFLVAGPDLVSTGGHSLNFLSATHPLLVRHADSPSASGAGATNTSMFNAVNAGAHVGGGGHRPVRFQVGQRQMGAGLMRQGAVRQRAYRYVVNAQPNNSPAILQRLLGPNIANELMQMAQQLPGGQGSTRVVITDDSIPANRGYYEEVEPNSNNVSGPLMAVPNAFSRLNDESRVMDGLGIHSLVTRMRQELLIELEKYRLKEFEERKEKRLEMGEEEKRQKLEKERQEKEAKEATAATKETEVTTTDQSAAATSADVDADSAPATTAPAPAPASGADPALETNWPSIEGEAVFTESELQPAAASTTTDATPSAATAVTSTEQTPTVSEASLTVAVDPDVMFVEQPANAAATATENTVQSSSDVQPVERHVQHPADSLDSVMDQPGPSVVPSSQQMSAELEAYRSILGDVELPEGVDPAFLAALPDNIRQEVIADQMRLQRLRQQNQQAARVQPPAADETAATSSVPEVSPEFLAALPPELQEEVLAQQRLAQQQLQREHQPPAESTFDPGSFLENLPPSLRQQVLADADDSQIALLPAHLAAEARRLRAQVEHHQAARFAAMSRQFPFMSLLHRSRESGGRYTIRSRQTNPRDGVSLYVTPQTFQQSACSSIRGQQLLDKEALACLLLLFFFDDQRLNVSRLHRIIRSLCCHAATRDWIIRALFSVLEQTKQAVESKTTAPSGSSNLAGSSAQAAGVSNGIVCDVRPQSQSWLNLTLNTALGNRADVFTIRRSGAVGRRSVSSPLATVHIHALAVPSVCRHVLDTLISLAKGFPAHFLPESLAKLVSVPSGIAVEQTANNSMDDNTPSTAVDTPKTEKSSDEASSSALEKRGGDPLGTDFWDVLLRLDATSLSSQRRTKQTLKPSQSFQLEMSKYRNIDESPFAFLLSILRHPTVVQNQSLMDRVLRLVSLIACVLPENAGAALEKKRESRASQDGNFDQTRMVLHKQFGCLVEVVTRGLCSDEGLEDGRAILLQAVRCFGWHTREGMCQLLFDAARELGESLCRQIDCLLRELSSLKARETSDEASTSTVQHQKGTLTNRYGDGQVVVNVGATPPRMIQSATTKELQLPSMIAFTQKNSTQQCLLRTLNTVSLLREAMKQRQTKQTKPAVEQGSAAAASAPVTSPVDITPMETDEGLSSLETSSLSQRLQLDDLWNSLSRCLARLSEAADPHAVLVLQPAAETFFLVHAGSRSQREAERQRRLTDSSRVADSIEAPPSPAINEQSVTGNLLPETSVYSLSSGMQDLSVDTKKLLRFAEEHRRVLNQILRQSTTHLADGPFAVLVDFPRILDFDVKRRYFRRELERADEGLRREDVAVRVRREHVFQDSFRELFRLRNHEWKSRFYIIFEGEEGQDAGGLLREWFSIITREIFNPNYALFMTSPGDRVTYMINPSSYVNREHLEYFKFVGRIIAKAIYDNKLLDCYFTRAFYKHILSKSVRYSDLESEDPDYYQSLVYLLDHPVDQLGYELTYSLEVEEFGVREVRDLKPNGRNITVTDDHKDEYVRLVCQMKMTSAIRQQLTAFLEGFYDIIPKHLIAIFNEQEMELLISGLPTIDIDDLQQNTEYYKYTKNSIQVQWLWRALRTFDQADLAKFLQFVTGTSKVPLQGFASLEGMHGVQRFQIHRDDRSTERLPAAHTCFNQLDLPAYESYDKLRNMLLTAIRECSEGFGFA